MCSRYGILSYDTSWPYPPPVSLSCPPHVPCPLDHGEQSELWGMSIVAPITLKDILPAGDIGEWRWLHVVNGAQSYPCAAVAW